MKNPIRTLIALMTLSSMIGLSLDASAQGASSPGAASSTPPVASAEGTKAGTAASPSAANGEKKASMCIGCHGIPGYQASFPEIYKVPMIAGQNAKYIVSALTQYKKGDRKHPTMRAIATSLSDEDMADLAAFYSTESKAEAVPTALAGTVPTDIAELLKKGNCASCHGANFNTPIDPSYPKLSGQHADYLFMALKAYQTDKNPQVGRNNAIMMGMARLLTHAEAKTLANYFASLPSELKTVPQPHFK